MHRANSDQYIALWMIRWMLLIGLFRLLGRGTDYLTGDVFTVGITEIGSDIPQIVWGVVCLAAATVIITGMLRGCLRIQAFGCMIAGAMNCGFAAVTSTRAFTVTRLSEAHGAFQAQAHWWAQHVGDWWCAVPVDDWRFPADYVAAAAQWAVLAIALVLIDAVRRSREEDNGEH